MRRPYRRNIQCLRHTQGCLTDCVAYLLNVHPWRVPYFVYPGEQWVERLTRFFRRRGYRVYWRRCLRPPTRGTHIVCGDSLRWKTAAHVVIYRNGRLIFDPNCPSDWSDGRITHRLVVRKMD